MQTTQIKLPINLKGIAKILEISTDELKYCDHYNELREAFMDYNFGVLDKDSLTEKLEEISQEYKKRGVSYLSKHFSNAATHIQLIY